jgi:hypothetical protein
MASMAAVSSVPDPRLVPVRDVSDFKTAAFVRIMKAANSTDAEIDRAAAELKAEEDQRRRAAITAWDADEKRRADVRETDRRRAEEEEQARDSELRDKARRRRIVDAPNVLNKAIPLESVLHVPPSSIDKLLNNTGLVPLSTFLPKTMKTYGRAASASSGTDVYMPVRRADGTLGLETGVVALAGSTKLVPDRDLSLGQVLLAKNNMLRLMTRHNMRGDHIERWTAFYDFVDVHPLRNEVGGPDTLVRFVANYREHWYDYALSNEYYNQADQNSLEKFVERAEGELQREERFSSKLDQRVRPSE